MKNKQYPLHHDHGTVTISRDVFDSMTSELERLRPMETGLELAEADRDAYKKRVDELSHALKLSEENVDRLTCKLASFAELKRENERLVKCCKEYDSRQRIDERIKFNCAKQLRATKRALWIARVTALRRFDVEKYLRKYAHFGSRFWNGGLNTFNDACKLMQEAINATEAKIRAKAKEFEK